MQVIRAAEMGMCFGVEDALTIARGVADPRQVTIHGELVHNPRVSDELAAKGFASAGEGERGQPPRTPLVLITAHGVSDRERARLAAAGRGLIDTTCPLVRFAHERARALAAEGRFVLVVGRHGHVEVQGLTGDLERWAVVESAADVRHFGEPRLGVLAQTTTPPGRFAELLSAIVRANPDSDVKHADTICGPTRNRQAAMTALLAAVEAVVVVGGSRSNNTRELLRCAEQRGVPGCQVEGPGDLDPAWLGRFRVIGLTAGTSTLPETVALVEQALLAQP